MLTHVQGYAESCWVSNCRGIGQWCSLACALGRVSGRSFATPEKRLRSG